MQEEAPAASLLHVRDAHGGCAVLAVQCALVTNLAARFCVERAAVQHQLHSLARRGAAGGLAVYQQRDDAGLRGELVVAQEGSLAHRVRNTSQQAVRSHVHRYGCGLGLRALRLHGLLKGGKIHPDAPLHSNLLRDLKREAVGVVQHERLCARQQRLPSPLSERGSRHEPHAHLFSASRSRLGQQLVQQRLALLQCEDEALLFALQLAVDARCGSLPLR
jgi:hypothetical protein